MVVNPAVARSKKLILPWSGVRFCRSAADYEAYSITSQGDHATVGRLDAHFLCIDLPSSTTVPVATGSRRNTLKLSRRDRLRMLPRPPAIADPATLFRLTRSTLGTLHFPPAVHGDADHKSRLFGLDGKFCYWCRSIFSLFTFECASK